MAEANRHDEIQGKVVHVYDDIEEADNQLPLWWLWTFYGAILFAVGYWVYYEALAIGLSPMASYSEALSRRAAESGEISEELLVASSQNPEDVESGRAIYAVQCVVCHGEHGEGKIGPNLTDPYWIHGGAPVDIFHTIRDGVASAGMPAWGQTLGADAAQDVASYVLTLRGTNVPGKEPQGELFGVAAAEADVGAGAPSSADAGAATPSSASDAGATPEGAPAVEGGRE